MIWSDLALEGHGFCVKKQKKAVVVTYTEPPLMLLLVMSPCNSLFTSRSRSSVSFSSIRMILMVDSVHYDAENVAFSCFWTHT